MTPINLRRLEFEWRRIRRIPLPILVGKAATKFLGLGLGLTLLPVTALLHLAGYRHVTVFTDRIGHLALEPDCLLKEEALGRIPKRKWIMLAPPGRVANEHLLTYWQPHFRIVRNRCACFLIASMSRWGLMRHDVSKYARTIGKAQESFKVYANWGSRAPLLRLTPEDEAWGEQMLDQLGLPADAWFVCVHAREGGFSLVDEELHSHRNATIEHTIPAMRQITSRGGWVVRIGDATMTPLPPLPQVVDYAHHPLKSPRLDVILCATARFILGSTSGICLVGTVFGVPSAIANMVPTADLWYGINDLSIPKQIWTKHESRYLRFRELLGYPQGCYRYASQHIVAGLDLIENSPEDIEELVNEMMSRLEQQLSPWPEDCLTRELYKSILDERYASFYSSARIGATFFQKYQVSPITVSEDK